VTDLPEKIAEINMVVAELDKPPIQILIESKLVELAPVTKNELGIDWDKTLDILYNSDKLANEKILSVSSGAVFSTERSVQMGKLSAVQYAAMIDFLKTKTDAKLVSNPRLLATDNEESSISVGKTVPVASIQRGMGGQSDMVTFDYKEISVRLNVTPHVSGSDEITMYVNPVIEEISDWKILFGNEAPVTDKRSVNSIVTVKNGETVVIGGLIRSVESRTTKKVFLLGSLPLIGKLFQHEMMQDTQTDLMIFITPTITPVA
jgi:general secretion pathway protein D